MKHGVPPRSVWTEAEISLLVENFASASRVQLLEMFPGRRWKQIEHKANSCGVKRKYASNTGRDKAILEILKDGPLLSAEIGARMDVSATRACEMLRLLLRRGLVVMLGKHNFGPGAKKILWALNKAPPKPEREECETFNPILVEDRPDTLTAVLLGDPPFSRSALAQRMAGSPP